jgi:peptidoglycan hydrolase-like protein with peptidoglycan-binding domain
VSSFQSAHGLPVTGQLDSATWQALLQLEPAPVAWTTKSARAAGVRGRNGPSSAFERTRRYEIPPSPPGP